MRNAQGNFPELERGNHLLRQVDECNRLRRTVGKLQFQRMPRSICAKLSIANKNAHKWPADCQGIYVSSEVGRERVLVSEGVE